MNPLLCSFFDRLLDPCLLSPPSSAATSSADGQPGLTIFHLNLSTLLSPLVVPQQTRSVSCPAQASDNASRGALPSPSALASNSRSKFLVVALFSLRLRNRPPWLFVHVSHDTVMTLFVTRSSFSVVKKQTGFV